MKEGSSGGFWILRADSDAWESWMLQVELINMQMHLLTGWLQQMYGDGKAPEPAHNERS